MSLHPLAGGDRQARCSRRAKEVASPAHPRGHADGSGVVMIDGKMQDDATGNGAKVIVDLARQVAAKDAEYRRSTASERRAPDCRIDKPLQASAKVRPRPARVGRNVCGQWARARTRNGEIRDRPGGRKHRRYPFRGVIYDVDPFGNTEEWWLAIPEEVRPRDQPSTTSSRRNAEMEYIAYVTRAEPAAGRIPGDPIAPPADLDEVGSYAPRAAAALG